MNILDFAEKQSFYTGANSKRKWIITKPEVLRNYLEICEFKPALLKDKLNTSYATVKRFLYSANLWNLAKIRIQKVKGGRKRYSKIDKFGYKYADSKHDVINDRGEIVRRSEHVVVAELAAGRPLSTSEVVHHIDLDKNNNDPSNLLICKDNKQHRQFHGQLERLAGKLVQLGLIKFNSENGYFINEEVVDVKR